MTVYLRRRISFINNDPALLFNVYCPCFGIVELSVRLRRREVAAKIAKIAREVCSLFYVTIIAGIDITITEPDEIDLPNLVLNSRDTTGMLCLCILIEFYRRTTVF